MFQLLKKPLVLLFFCVCSVPEVGCDDVQYVTGTAGQNLTVTVTLKSPIDLNQVSIYRNNWKIQTLNISSRSCFSFVNHTMSTLCISYASKRNIHLIFTNLIHSGVYHVSVFTPNMGNIEESSKVNLTVDPVEYTTSYTTVAAALFTNTSTQLDQLKKRSFVLMVVPVFVVAMVLLIILLGLLYWSYRRKTEKAPAVNATSAPQVTPDVTCVEYCVLDFPNRAGEKVRSTEERVEYSPIVFPPRKPSAQDNEIKSTTQQVELKTTTLHHQERKTDKKTEKPKTSKPNHQKCQKHHT